MFWMIRASYMQVVEHLSSSRTSGRDANWYSLCHVAIVRLDARAAFDKGVDHDNLITRLRIFYGISERPRDRLCFFLDGWSMLVTNSSDCIWVGTFGGQSVPQVSYTIGRRPPVFFRRAVNQIAQASTPVRFGAPQGSELEPILYISFTLKCTEL